MSTDWHTTHLAGRVQRHVHILHQVAHHLLPEPDIHKRPDAAQAQRRFESFLQDLSSTTPRIGLSVPTADFVDSIRARSARYGEHLFACYKDPRIPATTNQEEAFFGQNKRMLRKALSQGSTTQGVVFNLGPEFLLVFHQAAALACPDWVKQFRPPNCPHKDMPVDILAYRQAQAELRQQEQPARLRRSMVRCLPRFLQRLLKRWPSPD